MVCRHSIHNFWITPPLWLYRQLTKRRTNSFLQLMHIFVSVYVVYSSDCNLYCLLLVDGLIGRKRMPSSYNG